MLNHVLWGRSEPRGHAQVPACDDREQVARCS